MTRASSYAAPPAAGSGSHGWRSRSPPRRPPRRPPGWRDRKIRSIFAYHANYPIDNKLGIIVDAEGNRANRIDENRAALAMVERVAGRFALKPKRLAADTWLTKLLKGRIDVFPGNIMVTYAQIRDTFPEEQAAQFTHHDKPISDIPSHLLLSKKVPTSEKMRARFNEGLKLLKESGKYDQIIADALAGKYAKPK